MIEDRILIENIENYVKIIHKEKVVYKVFKKNINGLKDFEFVLGPSEICGNIIGLYDKEYGWPMSIKTSEIKSINDLMTQYKKHPFIFDNNNNLAISISLSEYQEIRKKIH